MKNISFLVEVKNFKANEEITELLHEKNFKKKAVIKRLKFLLEISEKLLM